MLDDTQIVARVNDILSSRGIENKVIVELTQNYFVHVKDLPGVDIEKSLTNLSYLNNIFIGEEFCEDCGASLQVRWRLVEGEMTEDEKMHPLAITMLAAPSLESSISIERFYHELTHLANADIQDDNGAPFVARIGMNVNNSLAVDEMFTSLIAVEVMSRAGYETNAGGYILAGGFSEFVGVGSVAAAYPHLSQVAQIYYDISRESIIRDTFNGTSHFSEELTSRHADTVAFSSIMDDLFMASNTLDILEYSAKANKDAIKYYFHDTLKDICEDKASLDDYLLLSKKLQEGLPYMSSIEGERIDGFGLSKYIQDIDYRVGKACIADFGKGENAVYTMGAMSAMRDFCESYDFAGCSISMREIEKMSKGENRCLLISAQKDGEEVNLVMHYKMGIDFVGFTDAVELTPILATGNGAEFMDKYENSIPETALFAQADSGKESYNFLLVNGIAYIEQDNTLVHEGDISLNLTSSSIRNYATEEFDRMISVIEYENASAEAKILISELLARKTLSNASIRECDDDVCVEL